MDEYWQTPGIEYWRRALEELGLDEQRDLEAVEEKPGEAIPRGKYHTHDLVFERAWEIARRTT
jgi:hypothetical protein